MQIGAILILKLEFLCNSTKHAFQYTLIWMVMFWRIWYSGDKAMAVKNTLARTSVLCKIILVHVAREQDKFFMEHVHTLCLCFIIVKAILSFIVSVCSRA